MKNLVCRQYIWSLDVLCKQQLCGGQPKLDDSRVWLIIERELRGVNIKKKHMINVDECWEIHFSYPLSTGPITGSQGQEGHLAGASNLNF